MIFFNFSVLPFVGLTDYVMAFDEGPMLYNFYRRNLRVLVIS